MENVIEKHIENIIVNSFKNHNLIIWYDPKEYFKNIFKSTFTEYIIIKFENSYYDVRNKAEQYFRDIEHYKLLIYVNKNRDKENFPLVEIEKAGIVFDNEGVLERNTEPSVLVREAIKEIVSNEFTNEIIEKVKKRQLTLEEVQSLVDKADPIRIGTLSLIFQTDNPINILLKFLTNSNYDEELNKKDVFINLQDLSKSFLKIKIKKCDETVDFRNLLAEYIILSEFVRVLDEKEKKKFENLNLIDDILNKQELINLLKEWRNRLDLQEIYADFANKVQKKYFKNGIETTFDKLINSETFCLIDDIIIRKLVQTDVNLIQYDIIKLIRKRKNLFWSSINPEINLTYVILEQSFELILLIKQVLIDISNKDLSVKELLNKYANPDLNDKWYYIDQKYRILESKFYDLDLNPIVSDKLEILINKCRNLYSELINKQITVFTYKVSKENLINCGFILQNQIYNKIVSPIAENNKVAYIIVDALRYEMGIELLNIISNKEEFNIEPAIANIPTITNIGMLSLLSNTDDKIFIEYDKDKLIIKINGTAIKDRKSRVEYFRNKINRSIEIFKLEDIVKPKKSDQERIINSDLILITSQEIDLLNEAGNEILTKSLMSDVLLNIKRAINHLVKFDIKYFIISSDHGFLLGSEIGKDNKINVPNGRKFELHKRCWIGLGGNDPENTIRIKGNKLGYETEVDFVFPAGNSIFNITGSDNIFVHSGISFQEIVIPVLKVKIKETIKDIRETKGTYQLKINKDIISNRIFTVKAEFLSNKIEFSEDEQNVYKVKILAKMDNEIIGKAETSEYGFIETTKEIELVENQPNIVTIVLNEKVNRGNIDIIMYDSITQLEVFIFKNIPLNILI